MSELRLFAEPAESPSRADIDSAVTGAGGTLVDTPAAATAILWRSGDVAGLRAALHPGIGWVQLGGVGIEAWLASDVLDHPATFTYAGGYFGEQVAEHALALLLACSRRLMTAARQDSWARGPAVFGEQLSTATVTVVGTGDIGSSLLRMLQPLGPRLYAVNRSGRAVPEAAAVYRTDALAEVLPLSDYVVLCVPSTAETRGLFDAALLSRMRPTAYLVNVGRGDAVDTDALVGALDRGALAGAALDVTDPEPLPDGHPLWRRPRVLVTPHVANPPRAHAASLLRVVAENARRFVAGDQLVSRVDRGRGY